MSVFCDIDNAYSNNLNKLDEIARAVNNTRKNNINIINDVHNDYKQDKRELENGLEKIKNMKDFNILPGQDSIGDDDNNSNYSGTLIKDIYNSQKNSSESIVPSGIAPQLTAIYFACFLCEY